MKHNFTSRRIIGSLFFPILICLIFGTSFVIFSIGKELNALRLGCLFSTLLGGFLPIVITLITKTDTSLYLYCLSSERTVGFYLLCMVCYFLVRYFINILFSAKVQNGFRTINCHYFKSDSVHSSVSDMLRL